MTHDHAITNARPESLRRAVATPGMGIAPGLAPVPPAPCMDLTRLQLPIQRRAAESGRASSRTGLDRRCPPPNLSFEPSPRHARQRSAHRVIDDVEPATVGLSAHNLGGTAGENRRSVCIDDGMIGAE